MKFNKRIAFIFFIFISHNYFCSTFSEKSFSTVINIYKSHPILVAIGIVLVLTKEPIDFVKNTFLHLIQEHPIISICLLGLLLTCSMDDLAHIQRVLIFSFKKFVRTASWLSWISDKIYT